MKTARTDESARQADGLCPESYQEQQMYVLGLWSVTAVLALTGVAGAQDPALANFFGFKELEVVKIDNYCGPMGAADVDGDGLNDLIVVNNSKSRLEFHYQKADASPDESLNITRRVNDLPEHWRFRRETVSVRHQIVAFLVHDYDGDGLNDVIYAGSPQSPEIVFLRQTDPGVFEVARKHRIRDLRANRNGWRLADLAGDSAPELVGMLADGIAIWPMSGDSLGAPRRLAPGEVVGGERLIASLIEDYNGDGVLDVAAVLADSPAPLRLWLGSRSNGETALGAELRFEMPQLRELHELRIAGQDAARLAAIERTTKRLVIYGLSTKPVIDTGSRDAAVNVFGFDGPKTRNRRVAVFDVDGDGLRDVIATDTHSNTLIIYRQEPGAGFSHGDSYATLTELEALAVGNVDDDPTAEVFVLSEKEAVVGRRDVSAQGALPFPRPLSISEGQTPVMLGLVELENGPHLAVVGKKGRKYAMDILDLNSAGDDTRQTVELESLNRTPETIIALDADQDGRTDLLVFPPEKPMIMLHAGDDGFTARDSDNMGQFGLVQAANADNTLVFDVDDDGKSELLIADQNYVRAVRYDESPGSGISPGWQVVMQVNAADSTSKLVSLTTLGDRVVAADEANERLVMMGAPGTAGESQPGIWREQESINVPGFDVSAIYAGRFSGGQDLDILAVGETGFAVVKLGGERIALKELAVWRPEIQTRQEHELASGDVNGDGYTDLIALDAGDQMCEVFTFSETGKLHEATEFQVFESKLFTGGEAREHEPSEAIIIDITGDGADDLLLLCHDRVLIYPQMMEPEDG